MFFLHNHAGGSYLPHGAVCTLRRALRRQLFRSLSWVTLSRVALLWTVHLQDIGLPYILDDRHTADTFFIVAEADHRFYKRDCIDPNDWLRAAGEHHFGRADVVMEYGVELEAEAAQSSAAASSDQPAEPSAGTPEKWDRHFAEPSAGRKRAYGAWTAGDRPRAPKAEVDMSVTPELQGLVAMGNQAARQCTGDLIWFSWNPSTRPGRRRQPGFGSQLLGITQAGAKRLQGLMARSRPAHWDNFIWKAGCNEMYDCSCYVFPPVGNFQEHMSGTIDVQRDDMFDKKSWMGTAVIPGPKDWPRQLVNMVDEKGAFELIVGEDCKLEFDSWKKSWWTQRPPQHPQDRNGVWQWLLYENWWLDRDGWFVGPAKGQPKGKGKKKCVDSYTLLREHPEWLINMSGDPSPISILATELVTDWGGGWLRENHPNTERFWHSRRKDIMSYKCRKFTDGEVFI